MKTKLILLAIGAFFGYQWYKGMKKAEAEKPQAVSTEKVKVKYNGPDLMHTGIVTKAGDIIDGYVKEDGSLIYEMWGNGIVASSHTFTIPKENYTKL